MAIHKKGRSVMSILVCVVGILLAAANISFIVIGDNKFTLKVQGVFGWLVAVGFFIYLIVSR